MDVEGCELDGSAIVAGRFTRRRSVARGHSIWQWMLEMIPIVSICGAAKGRTTYIPFALEGLQIYELSGDSLII